MFLCRIGLVVQHPRKRYEYERARFLRKRGEGYNSIKKELGLSKSTVSLWCRDIELSQEQEKSLRNNSQKMIAQHLGALANKKKREKEIDAIKFAAQKEIIALSWETLKLAGAMIYWAEGTKKKNTAITNSDPRLIKFMVSWFQKICGIEPKRLNAHLHIHYGNDERRIKQFWSKLTAIPLNNFGKSFVKPKGTGHRTNILPNGIIRIRVAGVGTENLRHRILAWVEKACTLAK